MTLDEFANLQEAFVTANARTLELTFAVFLVLVSLFAIVRLLPWQKINWRGQ